MKKLLFILLSLAGLLGLASVFYLGLQSSSKDNFTPPTISLTNMPRLFPEKALTMPNPPYLVNVWGTWCASCRVEHPVLMRLMQTLPIIGINWQDEPTSAKLYLKNVGTPYQEVFIDSDGDKIIELGVIAAPESFLVDINGNVLWHHAGPLTENVVQQELLPQITRREKP